MTNRLEPKELRNHCWQYFAFHAEQRMKLFNFYLLVTAASFAGITSLSKDVLVPHPTMAGLLSAMHFFCSYIFYKLDKRHKDLIGHAEDALIVYEKDFIADRALQIFTREAEFTKEWKAMAPVRGLLRGYFTCGAAFTVIYKGFCGLSFLFSGYFDFCAVRPYLHCFPFDTL